jgi:PAS domain S-box-containing protein
MAHLPTITSEHVSAGPPADLLHGAIILGEVVEDCDPLASRILGRPPERLRGKSLLELSPARQPGGADSAEALGARMRAARAGLAQSFEWRFLDTDGEPIDALVLLEASGPGSLLHGRVRDLTALTRAQSALRETEIRLQQIIDNTTAVIFVKDLEGRYRLVNRQFARVVQRPEAEIIGRSDEELFPPATAEALRANDLRVLRGLEPVQFEETHDEGAHTHISIKFPLFNAQREPYAVCGISTDITERKRIEQALRNVALGVSAAAGDDVFPAIAKYLAATLQVDFAFIGKLEGTPPRVHTLAVHHCGETADNIAYDLTGTPCKEVVGCGFQYIAEHLQARYPGDNMLSDLGFQSYAGYPLFDSRGRPLGLIAVLDRKPLVSREVAEAMLKIFSVRAAAELERLQAEEATRASEASYRAIFEASDDAIFVHDIDTGAIVDVNPKACETYGYTYEEMLRVDVGALSSGVHPYTLAEAARQIERAKRGAPVRLEWHRKNKDGSLHWDEVCLRRATIAGVERIICSTREITERKQREEALRKSEGRLRATVTAALDCIVSMDASGRIIEFNPAAETCFGHRREEVLGRSLADVLIPARHREAHRTGLARYAAVGEGPFIGKRVEVSGLRADGSEFPAELAIAVAQGAEGDIFIGYLRDITERRQAEEERTHLEAQLRQAQKMEAIGHLSGGIAHDFNNILTGILGYVALAQERSEDVGDGRLGRYLERAQQSAQRARDLIGQLLTFSRGQRGAPRPLALAPLVEQSVQLLGSTFPATLAIRTDLDGAAPAVMLDRVQADQVLMNLCINARDAVGGSGRVDIGVRTAHQRRAVCASCRQSVDGEFVELSVRDTGPGIAREHLDRLFEPFFTTKAPGKGSGMGLSTVHGIVHEHGGHILVDTAPGAGAMFRVLFPPLDAPAEAAPGGRKPAPPPGRGVPLRGRALVVDDDEAAGEFIVDLFESWGLEVVAARNGSAGRAAFDAQPHAFDLALLDQTMPGMTGLELARHLLAQRPALPVILYTGYSEALSEARARAAGVRALIRKPVDIEALLRLLKDCLAQVGQPRG